MIFTKVIISSLLVLSFSPISRAFACPKGEPSSTDYIRRDNNRCEGIKADTVSGNSLNFVSISTNKLSKYGDKLTIQIPQIAGGDRPNASIKYLGDGYHYQLDDLLLSKNTGKFRFTWNSYVLKTKDIPPQSLRGLASYNLGSQSVYVPILFGGSDRNYEFVFYSESRVKFSLFEIITPDGKQIYGTNQLTDKNGETIFNWNGINVPSGRYQIHYIAFVERKNQPSDRIEQRIVFEHDSNWLK
jgi:flagellar hook assembly protein FlgD